MSGLGASFPLNTTARASDGKTENPMDGGSNAAHIQGGNPGLPHMGASAAKAGEASEKKIGELLINVGKSSDVDRPFTGPEKDARATLAQVRAMQARLQEQKAASQSEEEKKNLLEKQQSLQLRITNLVSTAGAIMEQEGLDKTQRKGAFEEADRLLAEAESVGLELQEVEAKLEAISRPTASAHAQPSMSTPRDAESRKPSPRGDGPHKGLGGTAERSKATQVVGVRGDGFIRDASSAQRRVIVEPNEQQLIEQLGKIGLVAVQANGQADAAVPRWGTFKADSKTRYDLVLVSETSNRGSAGNAAGTIVMLSYPHAGPIEGLDEVLRTVRVRQNFPVGSSSLQLQARAKLMSGAPCTIEVFKGSTEQTYHVSELLVQSGNSTVAVNLVAPHEVVAGDVQTPLATVTLMRTPLLTNVEKLKGNDARVCSHAKSGGMAALVCKSCLGQGVAALVLNQAKGGKSCVTVVTGVNTDNRLQISAFTKGGVAGSGPISEECPACGELSCFAEGYGDCILKHKEDRVVPARGEFENMWTGIGVRYSTRVAGKITILVAGDRAKSAIEALQCFKSGPGRAGVAFDGLEGAEIEVKRSKPDNLVMDTMAAKGCLAVVRVMATNDVVLSIIHGETLGEHRNRYPGVANVLMMSDTHQSLRDGKGRLTRDAVAKAGLHTFFDVVTTEKGSMEAVGIAASLALRERIGAGQIVLKQQFHVAEKEHRSGSSKVFDAYIRGPEHQLIGSVTDVCRAMGARVHVNQDVPAGINFTGNAIYISVGIAGNGAPPDLVVLGDAPAEQSVVKNVVTVAGGWRDARKLAEAVTVTLDRKRMANGEYVGDEITATIKTRDSAEGYACGVEVKTWLSQETFLGRPIERMVIYSTEPAPIANPAISVDLTTNEQFLRWKRGATVEIELNPQDLTDKLKSLAPHLNQAGGAMLFRNEGWVTPESLAHHTDDARQQTRGAEMLAKSAVQRQEEPRQQTTAAPARAEGNRKDAEVKQILKRENGASVAVKQERVPEPERRYRFLGIATFERGGLWVRGALGVSGATVQDVDDFMAAYTEWGVTGTLMDLGAYPNIQPAAARSQVEDRTVPHVPLVVYTQEADIRTLVEWLGMYRVPLGAREVTRTAKGPNVIEDRGAAMEWMEAFAASVKRTNDSYRPLPQRHAPAVEEGRLDFASGVMEPPAPIRASKATEVKSGDEDMVTPIKQRPSTSRIIDQSPGFEQNPHPATSSEGSKLGERIKMVRLLIMDQVKSLKPPPADPGRKRDEITADNEKVLSKLEQIIDVAAKFASPWELAEALLFGLVGRIDTDGAFQAISLGEPTPSTIINKAREHFTNVMGDPALQALTTCAVRDGEATHEFLYRLEKHALVLNKRRNGAYETRDFFEATVRKAVMNVQQCAKRQGMASVVTDAWICNVLREENIRGKHLAQFLRETALELESYGRTMQLKHDAMKKDHAAPARVHLVDDDGSGEEQPLSGGADVDWEMEAREIERWDAYDQVFTTAMVDEQWTMFADLVREKSDFVRRLTFNGEPIELYFAKHGVAPQDWNRCYSCGKTDHWSKDCPNWNKDLPYAPQRLFFTRTGEPRMYGQELKNDQPKRRFFDQGVNIARAAPRVQQAAANQYAQRVTATMQRPNRPPRGPSSTSGQRGDSQRGDSQRSDNSRF